MATRRQKLRRIVETALANGWNTEEYGNDPAQFWTDHPDWLNYMLSGTQRVNALMQDHRFITAFLAGRNLEELDRGLPVHIDGIRADDPIRYLDGVEMTVRIRERESIRVTEQLWGEAE